jgi:hypothetical protein
VVVVDTAGVPAIPRGLLYAQSATLRSPGYIAARVRAGVVTDYFRRTEMVALHIVLMLYLNGLELQLGQLLCIYIMTR